MQGRGQIQECAEDYVIIQMGWNRLAAAPCGERRIIVQAGKILRWLDPVESRLAEGISGIAIARKRLGELLLELRLIDEATLQTALQRQRRWSLPLGRTLIEMQALSEADLIAALGEHLGIPSTQLVDEPQTLQVARQLDEAFCRKREVVAFREDPRGGFLDLALANPADAGVIDEVRVQTRRNIRPYLAGPLAVQRVLDAAFRDQRPGERLEPRVVGETEIELDPPSALQPVDSLELPIDIAPTGEHSALAVEVASLRAEVREMREAIDRTEQLVRRVLVALGRPPDR